MEFTRARIHFKQNQHSCLTDLETLPPLLYLCSKETGWYSTVSHKASLLVNIQRCFSRGWILMLRRTPVFCTYTLSCSSNPGSRLLPLSIMYRRPLVWTDLVWKAQQTKPKWSQLILKFYAIKSDMPRDLERYLPNVANLGQHHDDCLKLTEWICSDWSHSYSVSAVLSPSVCSVYPHTHLVL